MTTKEIAQAVGKDERSVRRWIKKVADKMSVVADKMSASTSTYPADYTQDETLAIIETGMGKNAAAVYRMNAEKTIRNIDVLSDKDISIISKIVSATVAETIKQLDGRISIIENRVEQRAALLPAPQIAPRDRINMIIRNYASKKGVEYSAAWSELYKQFSYRTNSNPSLCAKNRGMKIIDYIETEGQIDILESVAQDIFAA